jgi:hypothetical protein
MRHHDAESRGIVLVHLGKLLKMVKIDLLWGMKSASDMIWRKHD